MKIFTKLYFKVMALCVCLVSASILVSCNKQGGAEDIDVLLNVPSEIMVDGSDMLVSFRIIGGMSPSATDRIEFAGESKSNTVCEISNITPKKIEVILPESFESGKYKVSVLRGSASKLVGETTITVDRSKPSDVDLKEGNNVYGKVSCNGQPLSGVVVSDGFEVAATDAEGFYQFKSEKANGYVFMSIPSGYTVATDGVLPVFHKKLIGAASVVERADFEVFEDKGQENHTMLYFGDMHLARRSNDDLTQFTAFMTDVNDYLAANKGKKVYAITLGDMTWDLYWYSNNYALPEYLQTIKGIKNLPIFQTIGNHDHDMLEVGDIRTVIKYHDVIGPNYYSFNIGSVHYVVLDDILCKNDGTSGGRADESNLTDEQVSWLAKDLSYIKDKQGTSLVVCMHAPLYGDLGFYSMKNSAALVNLISEFSQVHVFTGHTHKMYNTDNLSSNHIYEHNAGAVCATWWWSGKLTPGINICQDGTSGGYTITDVAGTDFKWQYKGTGRDISDQFRTYDRNSICITGAKYMTGENTPQSNKTAFDTNHAGEWATASNSNEVYINVWNYDPQWTVTVTENGKELPVTRTSVKDPLHLVAYTAPAMDGSSALERPTFPTSLTRHMFVVKASSANSTLEILVKDRFGNEYRETMTRPKPFNAETYR